MHNLSADTASEVRQMPAQIILDVLSSIFGNADAVPQLPERFAARRECAVLPYGLMLHGSGLIFGFIPGLNLVFI